MTYTQQPPGATVPGIWQYHTEQIKPGDIKAYEQRMNQMGADGWELVNAVALSLHGAIRIANGETTTVQMIWKKRLS